MFLFAFLFPLALAAPVAPASQRIELQAAVWYNPLTIRVPEDRTYVLFFFTTVQKREVKPFIPELNKLSRRRDVVVIGLSPESPEQVKKFVDKYKLKFAVGARSQAYRRFGIKRFPRLIQLDPKGGRGTLGWSETDLTSLAESLPVPPTDDLAGGPLDKNTPIERLRKIAREGSDRDRSREALGLSRGKLSTQEFMSLCDEVAATAHDPWLGASALYYKHLADPSIPDTKKEPMFAPSVKASHSYRENPDDPKWAPLNDYSSRMGDNPDPGRLFEDFLDHSGDDPNDLLIRRGIASSMEEAPDRERAREYLMQMLPGEPDFVVRQRIVGALSEVCDPGDFEVAGFLEEQLKTESNIRVVPPMMNYVIRYLRTGEE